MNDVLLINRIIPGGTPEKARNMTFILGDMHDIQFADKVADLIQETGFSFDENVILKYNGVEIRMLEQDIPEMIRIFNQKGIDVYGVYHLYSS